MWETRHRKQIRGSRNMVGATTQYQDSGGIVAQQNTTVLSEFERPLPNTISAWRSLIADAVCTTFRAVLFFGDTVYL